MLEAAQGAEMETCDLCYNEERKIDFFALEGCGHKFCKFCFEDYLAALIEEGKVMNIGCMQSGCEEEFTEEDVKACINKTLFIKYKRFVTNARVDLDPDLRWCPKPFCDAFVRRNKDGTNDAKCIKCKSSVCFACGELSHPGRECGQTQKDDEFEKWKKENGAVHCPKCSITVYKYEGCNHMTCSNCRHQFCLYDLQDCFYHNNHYRKALFPCVCGQFGEFTKEQLYSGLERQRKCIPCVWFAFWMKLSIKIIVCWKAPICWLIAFPLTLISIPVCFLLFILTLPFCWCKLQCTANNNLLRVRKEHGLETKVSCFGCCLSYKDRGY